MLFVANKCLIAQGALSVCKKQNQWQSNKQLLRYISLN